MAGYGSWAFEEILGSILTKAAQRGQRLESISDCGCAVLIFQVICTIWIYAELPSNNELSALSYLINKRF